MDAHENDRRVYQGLTAIIHKQKKTPRPPQATYRDSAGIEMQFFL